MKIKIAFWLIAANSLALLFSPAISQAATPLHVYIAPKGNDNNSGLSPDKPKKSLIKVKYFLQDYFFTKKRAHRNVIVHVASGKYYGQTIRWDFHLPNHSVTIQGDPTNYPIFDGSGIAGQVNWMRIVRGSLKREERYRFTIQHIRVQDYHTAMTISGSGSGYAHSDGGVILYRIRFVNIGRPFDDPTLAGSKESHAAIYISGSHGNIIKRSVFRNITNDTTFSPAYGTGGLHAIYVNRSNRTQIIQNRFEKVYARGVIKFRNFSHFGRVEGNSFLDNTSLLQDHFINLAECAQYAGICVSYKGQECPSYGIKWIGNSYKYQRNTYRPNIDLDLDTSTAAFCESEDFFQHYQLDPTDRFNFPHRYYQRLYQENNVLDPNLK